MKRFFDQELDGFRSNLNRMGKLAIGNVEAAVKALLENNAKQAKIIVKKDDEIDDLEVKIDHEAVRYLSLRSPLARDLRLVTICMKISHDLERVGDEATAIAKRAVKFADRSPITDFFTIPRMLDLTLDMLRDSFDSFVNNDADKAHKLFVRDRIINDLHHENSNAIKAHIQENPASAFEGIELLFVSKSLEKIADHATNIGEEVIFLVSGEDLRHTDETSRSRNKSPKKAAKTNTKPAKKKTVKKQDTPVR